MKKEKDELRGVKTVSWDEAVRMIESHEYVVYRADVFDEDDIVPTMKMISTLAELRCDVDIFLSKKDGCYHISRPTVK